MPTFARRSESNNENPDFTDRDGDYLDLRHGWLWADPIPSPGFTNAATDGDAPHSGTHPAHTDIGPSHIHSGCL